MAEQADISGPEPTHKSGSWWRILLGTMGAYLIGIALLVLTRNPNLFPTVVLIGSLMFPIAYVSFFYERRHLSALTMPTTVLTFLYGGLLGVFAASLLEPVFVTPLIVLGGRHTVTPAAALMVGFVEEFVKIIGVLLIARHRRHDSQLDGMILGAAAGMGFAALESMGYSFTIFLRSQGNLSSTVAVTLLRGLISPLGHGTWTALLVGILFRESITDHFRLNLKVIGAYLTVVILHALWDGLPTVLALFAPTGIDLLLGQLSVGAVGLILLWHYWRQAVRAQQQRETPSHAIPPQMTGT